MDPASPDVFQGVTGFTVTPFLFRLLKAGTNIFCPVAQVTLSDLSESAAWQQ